MTYPTKMTGTKEATYLTRSASDGVTHRMPVGAIHGAQPGERITIYGGQHGTEYASLEAVQRLYRTLDPGEVRGDIVISLAANDDSFRNWIQFAPTPPEVMEMMLECAKGSQYIINCHGGEFTEAMCPYVICRRRGQEADDAVAMRMATVFGLGVISVSQYRGEAPSDPSGVRPAWWLWPKKSLGDELGIPEIIPEFGEMGGRNDGPMYEGILNVLRDLNFLDPPAREMLKPLVIGERYWVTADEQGIFFPEVSICQDVAKGQRLGLVRDYFGQILQVAEAPADARVMNMNVGMPVAKHAFLLWLGVV